MASSDTTSPSAENPGIQVNANKVQSLHVADRIVHIQPSHQNDKQSPGWRNANQDRSGHARNAVFYCMLDTHQANNRPCRFIQTDLSPVLQADDLSNLMLANQYYDIRYYLNSETVQKLLDGNCSVESMEESMGQCLAALDWSLEAIVRQKCAAFRLTLLEEKMPRLLQDVLYIVSNHSDLRKMIHLLTQAFSQFGAQLRKVGFSSLVFVFQFADEAKAEEMLGSEEAQGKLVSLLYQFLPEWVRIHARWEVRRCEVEACEPSSMCDGEPLAVWRLPRRPTSAANSDWEPQEAFGEARLTDLVEVAMERSFERFASVVDRALVPLYSMLDQLGHAQRAMLRQDIPQQGSPQQDLQQQLAPQQRRERQQQSSETDWTRASPLHQPSEGDQTLGGPVSIPPEVSLKAFTSLTETEGIKKMDKLTKSRETSAWSGPSLMHQGSRTSTVAIAEMEEQRRGLTGRLGSKDLSSEHHSLDPKEAAAWEGAEQSGSPDAWSPQFKTESLTWAKSRAGLSECLEGQESLEELLDLQKSEKFFNRSRHAHPPGTRHADSGIDADPECEETTVKGIRLTSVADTEPVAESKKRYLTLKAEELLSWVNVKSRASESTNPEIQRMMEQMEIALEDEEVASPLAKAMDTVLVLDTSDSVAQDHLQEVKEAAHAFVDGIEDNVETMNMEENVAVLQMGGRTWVRQHLTNDYNRVRQAIDAIGADSELMPVGGKTPLFQALVVCLAALEGRGGVISIAGCHRVRPRLIFFTDGRPTDEASEMGPDIQSNIDEVKYSLVQLITELASKKHRTTPVPISWVPVGSNVDLVFLSALAKLGAGKVVDKENMEELCHYFKVEQTIGCVYKLVSKNRNAFDDEQKVLPAITALAGNLKDTQKAFILEQVMKKLMEPEQAPADSDDFHNVFEDTELVKTGKLLALGTRVIRGPDLEGDDKDAQGPGTVVQHRKKRDKMVHVMWDNGTHNVYRYDEEGCYDIMVTKDCPRMVGPSEPLAIGVQVTRGDDWKGGNEDDNGTGVVIRTYSRGKVKVRWETGYIGKYTYGLGLQEVKPLLISLKQGPLPKPDEELGAVGGFDPSSGPSRRVWQWWDSRSSSWRTYQQDIQDKLLKAYTLRVNSSCVIKRDGAHRRVIFSRNEERNIDGRAVLKVQSKVVTEEEYVKMLQEEELREASSRDREPARTLGGVSSSKPTQPPSGSKSRQGSD